jgi:hypothetical protein
MNGGEVYIIQIFCTLFSVFHGTMQTIVQSSCPEIKCSSAETSRFLPETTILIRAEPIKSRSRTMQNSDLLLPEQNLVPTENKGI